MLSLETFKLEWDKQFPDIRLSNTHFILAVSGGVDSIVLTHLIYASNAACTIAHVNFQLRGEESTRDEEFVKSFAKKLSIPFLVHQVDTAKYAQTYKMGIQEAAREIRYAWFGVLINEITLQENNNLPSKPKSVVLLTAHHANDQAETLLMHLFRGTGLHGLTGIPMRRKDHLNIARPLLNFSKAQIIAYAESNGLTYVQDSSNEKDEYSRNYIRNVIMPQVEKVYPNANENIIATISRLKEADEIVQNTINAFWEKGIKTKKGKLSISIDHWLKTKYNPTYTWGLIKNYDFNPSQIQEVHKILTAHHGASIASSTHQFVKWNDRILIIDKQDTQVFTILEKPASSNQNSNTSFQIKTSTAKFSFEFIENLNLDQLDKNPNLAYLDAHKITWPLLIRTWNSTDYFYPFGLGKKKKLNQFLSNSKLNPQEKQSTQVLCVGDKIAWVLGLRLDDRFKIQANTPLSLKITWEEL